jgi:hypothetical protein
LFELRDQINDKDQQIEDLCDALDKKEKEISKLEEQTQLKAQYGPASGKHVEYKFEKKKYQPTKGDTIDEFLARILNEADCPIPVRKLCPGKYMFGNDMIIMSAKANSLLVRVGGGYMDFKEYLINHAPTQLSKINALRESGDWDEEYRFQELLGHAAPHIAKQRGTMAIPRTGKVGAGAMKDATGMGSPPNSGRAS